MAAQKESVMVRSVLSTNHETVLEDHRSLREKKEVATVSMEGTGETLQTEIVHERSIDGRGIRVTEVDKKDLMTKDNEVESGTAKSVITEAWKDDKSEMSQDEAAHFLEEWLKLWAPQIDEEMVRKYKERAVASSPQTLRIEERPDSKDLENDETPHEKEGLKPPSMLAISVSGEDKETPIISIDFHPEETPLKIDETHSQSGLSSEMEDSQSERTSAFKPDISLLGQATKEDNIDDFITDPIKSIILGQKSLGQVSKEEKVRQVWVSGQLQKEERVSKSSNTKPLNKNADDGRDTPVPSISHPGKIAKEYKVKQLWISGKLKKEEKVSRFSNSNELFSSL